MTEHTPEAGNAELDIPLFFVSIPEMPMGALAEVETICFTQRAVNCLNVGSFAYTQDDVWSPLESGSKTSWDTGHDFALAHPTLTRDIAVNVSTRSIGYGCAAMAIVSANLHECAAYDKGPINLDIENLLEVMVSAAFDQVDFVESSGLRVQEIAHVRLYHIGANFSESTKNESAHVIDDGTRLRSTLKSVLGCRLAATDGKWSVINAPATTVVPVQAIKVISPSSSHVIEGTTVLGMQILLADPVHMENELWIHHGR
jgi:hypothetical protein